MNIEIELRKLRSLEKDQLLELKKFSTSEDRFFSEFPYLDYLEEYTKTPFYILMAKQDGKIAAALCYNVTEQEELNCGGSAIYIYLPAGANLKSSKKVSAPLFEKLIAVAKDEGKTSIQLGDCPLLKDLSFGMNIEIRGYLNGQTELEILPDDSLNWLRKSYRSLMSWGKKNLEIHLIDRSNFDAKTLDTVRLFHINVAGKETRSQATWEKQFAAIETSDDFVNLAFYEDKLVSANLIMTSKSQAFYGVGINDRELMATNTPIGHYPILQAMLHAKAIGKKVFDFGKLGPDYSNEKEQSIATFKKGFCQQLEIKNQLVLKL